VVDPIGAKPASPLDRRVAPVAAGTPAAPIAAVAEGGDTAHETASIAEAVRRAAEAAPVDHDRVAVLRAAVANGNYRPAPQTIADRMIGAMQEWIAR
jgi:flagellar biosynthesis anti-sigma factor FlgM